MRIVNFMSDTAVCSLAYGEHLTLSAFRTIAVGHGGCRAVARAFEDALDADARAAQRALAIFAYELGCATSARRLKVAPPGASNLTRDEASLLSLFGAAQSRGATEVRDRLAKLGVDAPGETLLAALFVYGELPDERAPRLELYVDREGGNDPEYYADQSGALVQNAVAPFTDFPLGLHIYLHLPRSWGVFVVGLTGVALLSSLVSGLLSHPRVFRDAFYLRWGGSKRLQEADLHNRISIWGLPFHVVISLTGALLGLTTIIVGFLALTLFQGDMDRAYSLFLPPHPIDNPAPAPTPGLTPMFDTIAREAPDGMVTQISYEHPGEAGQAVSFTVAREGQLSFGDSFTFDGSGARMYEQTVAQSSLGVQVLQAIGVLHFGWFGGWLIKLAYLFLGLGLTVVTTSGVAIWLARRRDKGRPAPAWERIWIATVWSQPAALALTACATLVSPSADPLAAWAIGSVAAVACAAALRPAPLSAALRVVTALLMLAAVIAHALTHQDASPEWTATAMNAAIVAVAVLLLATLAIGRKSAAQANAAPVSETP